MKKSNRSGSRYYNCDGIEYLGVTSAIKLCEGGAETDVLMAWAAQTPDYKEIQQGAMKFGTFMHKICEDYLSMKERGYDYVLTEEDMGYLVMSDEITYEPYDSFFAYEAFKTFVDDFVAKIILCEETIKSDKLMLAGTFDALVETKEGKIALIDFKFSKNATVRHSHKLQLAMYKYMLEESGQNVDEMVNFFPNTKTKRKPYTISRVAHSISREEVELVAKLAHLRIEKELY